MRPVVIRALILGLALGSAGRALGDPAKTHKTKPKVVKSSPSNTDARAATTPVEPASGSGGTIPPIKAATIPPIKAATIPPIKAATIPPIKAGAKNAKKPAAPAAAAAPK